MDTGAPVVDLVRVQLGTSWFLVQDIRGETKVTAPAICPCATCDTIRMGVSVTPDDWVKQHLAMDEGKKVARAILDSGEFLLPVEVVRAVGDPPVGKRVFEEEGGAGWESELGEEGDDLEEMSFEEFEKAKQPSKKRKQPADEAEKEPKPSKAPKAKKAKTPAPQKEVAPQLPAAESASKAQTFKKPKAPAPKKAAASKQSAAQPKPSNKGKARASDLPPLYVAPPPLPTPVTTPPSSDSEDGQPQPPTAEELEELDREYEAKMKMFREAKEAYYDAERERIKAQHESYARRGFPGAERLEVPDRRRST